MCSLVNSMRVKRLPFERKIHDLYHPISFLTGAFGLSQIVRPIEPFSPMQLRSTLLRIAAVSAACVLAACTTMSGPDDLLGSVGLSTPSRAPTPLPPPGPSSNPSAAPLTPNHIQTEASSPRPVTDEYVQEAPPMRVERLQDLPRRADGSMILPSASPLHVIDVQEVRNSLANSGSASGATRAPSATQGTQPSLPPVPPPPASN